jgi:hypothetical protein
VGQTLGRVLLHRVAEATVKDFLDRVGEAVTNKTQAGGRGGAGGQGGTRRDAP